MSMHGGRQEAAFLKIRQKWILEFPAKGPRPEIPAAEQHDAFTTRERMHLLVHAMCTVRAVRAVRAMRAVRAVTCRLRACRACVPCVHAKDDASAAQAASGPRRAQA